MGLTKDTSQAGVPRHVRTACESCGYSLEGLIAGRELPQVTCPECGVSQSGYESRTLPRISSRSRLLALLAAIMPSSRTVAIVLVLLGACAVVVWLGMSGVKKLQDILDSFNP